MSDKVISSTTQEFLDVYDVSNDMVLLKDGTVSMILQIGTMNFSLLAEEEQDAIIYTYGSLLNSLNFSIQINIQSAVKDASKYLRLLDDRAQQTRDRGQADRIKQYRDFVANLIHERNVLEKNFFIIIPAGVAEMGLYTAKNVLPGKTQFDITSIDKPILIEKAATILEPRRDHIITQFNRIGLTARQLNTQEIIQNFYVNYNPEAMEGQEITYSANYTTPLVRASLPNITSPISDQPTLDQPATVNSAPTPTPTAATAAPASNNPVVTPNKISLNQSVEALSSPGLVDAAPPVTPQTLETKIKTSPPVQVQDNVQTSQQNQGGSTINETIPHLQPTTLGEANKTSNESQTNRTDQVNSVKQPTIMAGQPVKTPKIAQL